MCAEHTCWPGSPALPQCGWESQPKPSELLLRHGGCRLQRFQPGADFRNGAFWQVLKDRLAEALLLVLSGRGNLLDSTITLKSLHGF